MSYVLLTDNHRDVDTLHYLPVSGSLVCMINCDSKRQITNINIISLTGSPVLFMMTPEDPIAILIIMRLCNLNVTCSAVRTD